MIVLAVSSGRQRRIHAIGFANLYVLKDQLHCKLQAQKAELGRLDHQHGQ